MTTIRDLPHSEMTLKELSEAVGISKQGVCSYMHRHKLQFKRLHYQKDITYEQKKIIIKNAHPNKTCSFISKKAGVAFYKTKSFLLENNLPFLKTTFDIEPKENYFSWEAAKKEDFIFA